MHSAVRLPRLLLAAPASGGGKTTVTCALLGALLRRGLSPAAFKCGPDYIDPMFHSEVLGVPSRNLDLFFSTGEQVRGLLRRHGAGRDIAVLEGVMGYYDGVADTDRASAWHLADATDTPALLILDPKGVSLTAAALVQGLCRFRERSRIAGVLLNRCGEGLYRHLAPLLERETGLPVLGYLPHMPDCAFESRHLGLVPAGEIAGLRERVGALAAALAERTDLDRLLELAAGAPPLEGALAPQPPVTGARPRIAVARDAAFCFYYPDNLELLEELGAELVPFSPLADAALPEGTAALYLGGGYPELHAEALAANVPMRGAVARAVRAGMPTFAECGGFQYLQRELADRQGRAHQMAGVLPGGSALRQGARRFGYCTLTALRDTPFLPAGQSIAAHEFHHWDSDDPGGACIARKPVTGREWACVHAEGALFAGYPHLYWRSNPEFARRFVRAAAGASAKL